MFLNSDGFLRSAYSYGSLRFNSSAVLTPSAWRPFLNSCCVKEPIFCAYILLDINMVTISEASLMPMSSKNFYRPSTSMFPVVESLYLANVVSILSAEDPPPEL